MGTPAQLKLPPPPGGVLVDASRWPLVVITLPERAMNEAVFCEYLAWNTRHLLVGNVRYATVLDSRKAAPLTARQRSLIGDRMKKDAPYNARYCAGTALIFDSAILRGCTTALFWMWRPAYPTKVFATAGEGIAWCEQRLAAGDGL